MNSWSPRFVLVLVALPCLALFSLSGRAQERPSYVGAQVCGTCHGEEAVGNQYQRWTMSSHARSYLALATGYTAMIPDEARRLVDEGHGKAIAAEARNLGDETQCLLCHGTGFEAGEEQWLDSFHIEDGVQCEACHGPGSAHVAMRQASQTGTDEPDPDNGRLVRMTLDDCTRCHREKASHQVLGRPPFDAQKAWRQISHPLPSGR